jgi:hypothetical protein
VMTPKIDSKIKFNNNIQLNHTPSEKEGISVTLVGNVKTDQIKKTSINLAQNENLKKSIKVENYNSNNNNNNNNNNNSNNGTKSSSKVIQNVLTLATPSNIFNKFIGNNKIDPFKKKCESIASRNQEKKDNLSNFSSTMTGCKNVLESIRASPKSKTKNEVDFKLFKNNAKIVSNAKKGNNSSIGNNGNMNYQNPLSSTSATAFISLTRDNKRSFTGSEGKKIEEVNVIKRNNSTQGVDLTKIGNGVNTNSSVCIPRGSIIKTGISGGSKTNNVIVKPPNRISNAKNGKK